jgi:hypothetical protein
LQMKSFLFLRSTAKRLPQSPSDRGVLREYEEQVKTSCTKARGWIDTLPGDSPIRGIELLWIEALETAASNLQPAIDTVDVGGILRALNEVRHVIRNEPFRLGRQIYVTARNLPLGNLTGALQKISTAVGSEGADLASGYAAMRDLNATLMGRVSEHKLWQDADNTIWDLEETFEHPLNEAREDFIFSWSVAKKNILMLAHMDPSATWSKNTQQYSVRVDDELARNALENALKSAFDDYRRETRFRFFGVDAQLKTDCAVIVRMGMPLHAILEDLEDG